MKVNEYIEFCKSPLKVLSAYNGKVLCFAFDKKKHLEIAEREILDVWADITVTNSVFGNYARPIMCCYVEGHQEYLKEKENKCR